MAVWGDADEIEPGMDQHISQHISLQNGQQNISENPLVVKH